MRNRAEVWVRNTRARRRTRWWAGWVSCGLAAWLQAVAVQGAGVPESELPPFLVAFSGADLPALLGVEPACIRASALGADADPTAGNPVPVQIDERYAAATGLVWAFEGGEEPRPDPDPLLDADDLVLLDVRDAGACSGPDGVRVQVRVPGGGCLHLACAPRTAGAPPRLRRTAGAAISGAAYTVGFAGGGRAWLERLSLGPADEAPNLLDRSKVRIDLALRFGLGTIARNEEDVTARLTGEHVGPLRIVREIEIRGRLLWNLYSRPVRDRFIFYPDGFSIPTSVSLPASAALLVRRVSLRLTMDLRPVAGLQFRSAPEAPEWMPVTGTGGRHGGAAPMEWYELRFGEIGLLGWLETDPAGYAREVRLYYVDQSGAADPPEGEPGQFGQHGFQFTHDGPLRAETVRLSTQAWIVTGQDLAHPEKARQRFRDRPRAAR